MGEWGNIPALFFPFLPYLWQRLPGDYLQGFFYLTNTLNRKQKRSACPQRGNIYWKLSLNSWNIKCIFGGKILPLVLVSR